MFPTFILSEFVLILRIVLTSSLEGDCDDEEEVVPEEKPITYHIQQAILLGRRLLDMYYVNFLESLSPRLIHDLSGSLTYHQQNQIIPYLRRVPMGLLLTMGPAGTDKTFVLAVIILLLIATGRKISIIAPSNVASINISNKVKALDQNDSIILRQWGQLEEEDAVLRYVPGSDLDEW